MVAEVEVTFRVPLIPERGGCFDAGSGLGSEKLPVASVTFR